MHDSILHILNTTKTRIQTFGPDAYKMSSLPQFRKRDFIAAVAASQAEGRVRDVFAVLVGDREQADEFGGASCRVAVVAVGV